MRALLASPLGFLIGLSLGALGGGGSILALPALVFAAGQDPRRATTTSLVLVGIAALVGLRAHLQAGRVRVGLGLAFGLVGVGGSLVGSTLNRDIDPDVLLLAFAGLVLVAAWRMLTGCPTCTNAGQEQALALPTLGGNPSRSRCSRARSAGSAAPRTGVLRLDTLAAIDVRAAATVVVVGSAVGLLTGLFGVGGGFVIVPALTLALKLPMPQAIGTSVLVIAVNAAAALVPRLADSSIDWHVTIPFAVAAIAGVIQGGRLADRLDPARSLRWFAALLVAVALYTAVRSGIALST